VNGRAGSATVLGGQSIHPKQPHQFQQFSVADI
jgi:hypothetical protein